MTGQPGCVSTCTGRAHAVAAYSPMQMHNRTLVDTHTRICVSIHSLHPHRCVRMLIDALSRSCYPQSMRDKLQHDVSAMTVRIQELEVDKVNTSRRTEQEQVHTCELKSVARASNAFGA